jgi:hypothetical protein
MTCAVQKATILFYSTPLEATRTIDEGASTVWPSVGQAGNALYAFEHAPTEDELRTIETCLGGGQ